MRAEGEARSAELVGEAVRKNKGFLELRRLEAAREIAATLSQSNNKVMLDSQSLLLNGEYKIIFFVLLVFKYFTVAGNDANEILKVQK